MKFDAARARKWLPAPVRTVGRHARNLVRLPWVRRYELLTNALAGHPLAFVSLPLGRRAGYDVREVVSFAAYAAEHPPGLRVLFDRATQLHYAAPRFDGDARPTQIGDDLVASAGPHRYGAVFTGCEVVGGSSLILLPDGRALHDLASHDPDRRYRYTDEASRYQDAERFLVTAPDVGPTIPRGLYLGGNFGWNLYHLLVELLIKLPMADALALSADVPLLVDAVVTTVPQFGRLLALLNPSGRRVIPLTKGVRYRVDELTVLSSPNFIPPNLVHDYDLRPSDTRFDLAALDDLRAALLAAHAPTARATAFPRRCYLSRRKASVRRRFNEDDVLAVLRRYGFEEVFPEDLSIDDQIALFQQAEQIVGGSGAAFTNLLFCSAGCQVLVLAKTQLPAAVFSTLAAHVGAELRYVTAESGDETLLLDFHEAFTIDPARIEAALSTWSEEPAS